MRPIVPTLLVTLALAATPARGEASGWDADLARGMASDAVTEPVTGELLRRVPLLDREALLERVAAVAGDPGLSLPARERVLRDFAHRMRHLPPDPKIRPVLAVLAEYSPRVRVPHPEGRSGASVPLFDVAAAARGSLNQWDWEAAENRAGRLLAQGRPGELIEMIAEGGRATLGGVLSAIRRADRQLLAAWAPKVIADPLPDAVASALAQAIGERLADPALLGWVVREGSPPWREQTLRDLDRWLLPAQAVDIWVERAENAPAAQAGIAMVALVASPSRPVDWAERLSGWLADPERGAAAAMALSRLPAEESIPALEKALASDHPQSRRRARLVIGSSPHPPVRALLDRRDSGEAPR